MSDPQTTLRMAAYPQLEGEQHTAMARSMPSRNPTLVGVPARSVNIEDLAFDAIPTHPALDLELAYYRTISAAEPSEAPPLSFEDALSHESTTQWQRPEYEPTAVIATEPTPALDLEVEVEAAMTSSEWALRFRPVSVRPPGGARRPPPLAPLRRRRHLRRGARVRGLDGGVRAHPGRALKPLAPF